MTVVAAGTASPPRFAVAGTRNGATVQHVGVLADTGEFACGDTVQAHQMAGGGGVQVPGDMVADAFGWLDVLDADEQMGIEDWIAQIRTLVESGRLRSWSSYVVLPAVQKDGVTDRLAYKRFSCAGFVAEAYSEGAGVPLVDERVLPDVDLSFTERVWGTFTPRQRAFAGLKDDCSWPVLLPGYLLNAMRLPRQDLPLRPTLEDAELRAPDPAPEPPTGPTE